MSDQDPKPDDKGTFSAEYVRELRAENKGLRLKNTELQTKNDAADVTMAAAIKTAVEEASVTVKAEALKEATADADKRVLLAELKGEAVKAGLVDLDQLKLLDVDKVKLVDGKLDGAEALFNSLKESKPYLFGSVSSSSTAQNPPPKTPPEGKPAKDMTPEEYSAAKAALLN
ncbi:phage scaffolding protein [Pseudomonas arsenicoxydans]|uniref:Scaffolding protein n=1 Tax=Pseudomonas arsenicoxydans TaxID=702115 RepID=A0A4P6GIT3_9PSED|nr:hypothetical protein [Pseudomonas arsenicoxydans]QAY85391.1 hypothetical protein CUN61_15935 [Pseudomonas arsenicoxydans]